MSPSRRGSSHSLHTAPQDLRPPPRNLAEHEGGHQRPPRPPGREALQPRSYSPSCRKSVLQAGGGALWVEGKDAG